MDIEKRIEELETELKNNARKYHNSKILTTICVFVMIIHIIYFSCVMNVFYDTIFITLFVLLLFVDFIGKKVNDSYIEITHDLICRYKHKMD